MSKKQNMKKKSAIPQDIKNIQETIKKIWPNYPYKEESLINLTSDFVVEFYSMYLNTFYDVIDFTITTADLNDSKDKLQTDFMSTCPKNIKKEIFLFAQLSSILREINITYFSITDLYAPQNRTRTTIKILLNLLLYMINKKCESDEIYEGELKEFEKCLESQNVQNHLMTELSDCNNENRILLDNLEREEFITNERLDQVKETEKIVNENGIKEEKFATLKKQIMQIEGNNGSMKENIINKETFDTTIKDIEYIKKTLEEKKHKIIEQSELIAGKSKDLTHLKRISTLLDTVDTSSLHTIKEIKESEQLIERENIIKNNLNENVQKLKEEIKKQKVTIEQLKNETKQGEKKIKNTCKDLNEKMEESVKDIQRLDEMYNKLELVEKELQNKEQLLNDRCKQIEADVEVDLINLQHTYQLICKKILNFKKNCYS